MPKIAESAISSQRELHDGLIALGWAKIRPNEPGAYERGGTRYLTWRKGAVLIASRGSQSLYAEPGRSYVTIYIGDEIDVTIEALMVEPAQRRQGHARAALKEWCVMADAAGVQLWLEPAPLEKRADGAPTRADLVRLYAEWGFAPQADGNTLALHRVAR